MTVTNNWRPRILVVDDDPTNLMLLERLLGRNGYDVVLASSGFEAIDAVKQATPDLILLDIRMPQMDGFETCRRLRSDLTTTETPILFLTAEGREDDNLAAGFEAGGNDYITKPFSKVDLLSRVRVNLEQVALRESYKQMALADTLTGLDNRRQLYARLLEVTAAARRHDWPLSVIMCDIDRFKSINDTYGHQFGDKVLRQFGRMLRAFLRTEDIAARYGGDEFTILLPNTDLSSAAVGGERIRKGWAEKVFEIDGERRTFTASFGLTCYTGQDPTPQGDDLIERADRALYMAKETGRNQVVALTWEQAAEPETQPASSTH